MKAQKNEEKAKGFDLTVTYRDDKTGQIIKQDPYIMRMVARPEGGKTKIWERPAGSGNIWNKAGKPIGRWVKDAKGKGKFVPDEPHIEFKAPETEEQKVVREITEKDTRIAELEKELAAIKAEAKPKNTSQALKK